MKQFEYKTISARYSIEAEQLNKLGLDGWELVSAFAAAGNCNVQYIFKRQLS